jgi:hypothetical protein
MIKKSNKLCKIKIINILINNTIKCDSSLRKIFKNIIFILYLFRANQLKKNEAAQAKIKKS